MLHFACKNEKFGVEVVKLFLSFPGLNVNLRNELNKTAIEEAEENKLKDYKNVIKLIADYEK